MSEDSPAWKENYPVRQIEEHGRSRREFGKFLGCAIACGAGFAAMKPIILPSEKLADAIEVAGVNEIPVGGYKLFKYPDDHSPCILVHLREGEFVAYSQSCTHLMCPVHYQPDEMRFYCPCHEGYFNVEDGSVQSGPPPRPLPQYPVAIKDGKVLVGGVN